MNRNRNAARKIEQAIRRGWTPSMDIGPARFLRRKAWRRIEARKEAANGHR